MEIRGDPLDLSGRQLGNLAELVGGQVDFTGAFDDRRGVERVLEVGADGQQAVVL